jgi:hypothetical protein
VWTNSRSGRFLCTAFGIAMVAIPFGVEPLRGQQWHGGHLVAAIIAWLVGAVVATAAWTSRLVLRDEVLTATNLGISRSMPLTEVVDVDPSTFPFFGMKIRRTDGSGIRTLVSGRSWDEWWTPRAERVAREIERLAARARTVAEANGATPLDLSAWEARQVDRYLAVVGLVFLGGLSCVTFSVVTAIQVGFDLWTVVGVGAGCALMLLAAGGFWARDA